MPGGLSLLKMEFDHHGGAHLDGRDATLRVTLGEMAVAGGVERPGHVHGYQQPGPLGQLFSVHVAAVLPGRDGAESFGGDGPLGNRVFGVGGKGGPAAAHQVGLPLGPRLQLCPGGRDPRGTHERTIGYPHARQEAGCRPAVLHLPMGHEGIGEQVAQEPGAGTVAGPAVRLGNDVDVLDLQQVSRLGPLYVNRAGQRVSHLGGETGEVLNRHAGVHLTVGGVAGLQRHFFAGVHLQDGGNVRVPAVVPLARIVLQPLTAVYLDALHGNSKQSANSGQL